jgi:hypothetical protein
VTNPGGRQISAMGRSQRPTFGIARRNAATIVANKIRRAPLEANAAKTAARNPTGTLGTLGNGARRGAAGFALWVATARPGGVVRFVPHGSLGLSSSVGGPWFRTAGPEDAGRSAPSTETFVGELAGGAGVSDRTVDAGSAGTPSNELWVLVSSDRCAATGCAEVFARRAEVVESIIGAVASTAGAVAARSGAVTGSTNGCAAARTGAAT